LKTDMIFSVTRGERAAQPHRRAVLGLLAGFLCLPAQAELSLQERLPLVRIRAAKLRRALLSPALDPYRVEADYADALQKAEVLWERGQGEQAILALARLQKYAPLAELPFIKAQLLMAAIAEQQRNTDLLRHHRAFATALVETIDASGDGLSEKTAFKLVLPSEADGWFIAHRDRYTPVAKMIVGRKRQSHDVWRARQPGGVERTLYFDVSPMLRQPAPAPRKRTKPAR
jgi:hypothetical protein